MFSKLELNLIAVGNPLIINYFNNVDERLLGYIHVLKELEILGIVSSSLSKEILSDIRDYYEGSLHLSPLYVDIEGIVGKPNAVLVNKYKKLLNAMYGKKNY